MGEEGYNFVGHRRTVFTSWRSTVIVVIMLTTGAVLVCLGLSSNLSKGLLFSVSPPIMFAGGQDCYSRGYCSSGEVIRTSDNEEYKAVFDIDGDIKIYAKENVWPSKLVCWEVPYHPYCWPTATQFYGEPIWRLSYFKVGSDIPQYSPHAESKLFWSPDSACPAGLEGSQLELLMEITDSTETEQYYSYSKLSVECDCGRVFFRLSDDGELSLISLRECSNPVEVVFDLNNQEIPPTMAPTTAEPTVEPTFAPSSPTDSPTSSPTVLVQPKKKSNTNSNTKKKNNKKKNRKNKNKNKNKKRKNKNKKNKNKNKRKNKTVTTAVTAS